MSRPQPDPQAPLAAVRPGRPLARRVWEAVNATERLICGEAAVDSGAQADGLALAGQRAARCLEPSRDEPPLAATIAAPWVDHRLRRGHPGGHYAFELLAADGQEAIDHCLVGHRLTAALRRPGLCSLDRELAESTRLVHLPTASAVDGLPRPDRAVVPDPRAAEIFEAVRTAFDEVSRETGRALEPISRFGPPSARYLLLAAGSTARLAQRTAARLHAQGISCAAWVPALVRPFPATELRAAAAGAEAIVVLSREAADAGETLGRRAEGIFGSQGPAITVVRSLQDDVPWLCGELARRFCLELSPSGPEDREEATTVVAVGVLPSDRLTEDLVLDAAARLGRLCAPRVDCRPAAAPLPSTITIGAGHLEDRPLDLLVVLQPAALSGSAALERVRERGTLLLRASTDDPRAAWSALDDGQRATIIRRRLDLRLVPPDAEQRVALEGAVLASTPGLDRVVGRNGDLLEALSRSAPPEEAEELRVLRAGARACVVADATRLGEPTRVPPAGESTPPRMAPEEAQEDATLRARLRHFHFSGHDPGGPGTRPWELLRPAVLLASDLEPAATAAAPSPSSPFELWALAVLDDRRRRRARYVAEAETLAERLRHTLGLPDGRDPGEWAARLGALGAEFVDSAELRELSRRKNARGVTADRAERLKRTLQVLQHSRRRLVARPAAYVLCPEERDGPQTATDVEVVPHADALRAAVGLFDGLAIEAVELARAVRLAKLEIGGNYDPRVHAAMLERLDRQSLTAEELLCIPAVLVLETARHLRGPALAAFSELIRAGRPVHVLVEERVADAAIRRRESGYHPGLGYLAVAHREALVVQSSTSRPGHLAEGFNRALSCLDPVVFIVAASPGDAPGDGSLDAAVQGRATPCFSYDPAGGTSWAERFSLGGNPQPEQAWPRYTVDCLDERGEPVKLEQSFTFAHAAALDPVWHAHFLVVGPGQHVDGMVEIADYVERPGPERSRSLPFLWIVRDATLVRAVITWELAFACRDRERAWRILQELAGTDNACARRAADEARQVAQEEAQREIEKVRAESSAATATARSAGAASAIERLVRMLADPRGLTAALATVGRGARESSTFSPRPSAAAATVTSAAAAQPAAPAAALALPYIDSFLCTSCNDCINVNPQLFRYNGNKQAEIADPAAGTFKQLVKAAEACPARCIHPGAPRTGDATATPALIKRAAKFD